MDKLGNSIASYLFVIMGLQNLKITKKKFCMITITQNLVKLSMD